MANVEETQIALASLFEILVDLDFIKNIKINIIKTWINL
jgi:hypothetical protein